MANLVAAVILLEFIGFLDANMVSCDVYGAVGQNLMLPFAHEELKSQNNLKWTHNNTVIFQRTTGRLFFGKPEDITPTGSLLLKNLQFTSAGNYKASVWWLNGTLEKEWDGQLCVMEKVPKPQLTYICDFNSNVVKLHCSVSKPHGLNYSWTIDERILTNEKSQSLSISLSEVKKDESFSCSVENKLSKERSDSVRLTCKASSAPLLCFPKIVVMVVLAGGAGLILLLLVVIVALCCCCCKHNKRQQQKTVKEEDKSEIISMSNQEPNSPSYDYEQMQAIDTFLLSTSPVSGGTEYASVSKLKAQSENPPQHLSAPAGVQHQASPVPKPRTRMATKPNI